MNINEINERREKECYVDMDYAVFYSNTLSFKCKNESGTYI